MINAQSLPSTGKATAFSALTVRLVGGSVELRCPYGFTLLQELRAPIASEHPDPVQPGDLEKMCGVCGVPLGAVTTHRLLNITTPGSTSSGASVNSLSTPSR